ncbi:hypothetical protein WZ76_18940 [Shouchella clausii]|nr:hypothetical protein WZ76_18940 [Shouchella clausii]
MMKAKYWNVCFMPARNRATEWMLHGKANSPALDARPFIYFSRARGKAKKAWGLFVKNEPLVIYLSIKSIYYF